MLVAARLAAQTTSWQPIFPFPTGNNLYTVKAFDNDRLLVAGDGSTVITTADGGDHWKLQLFVGESNGNKFYDADFANNTLGLAVGHDKNQHLAVILRTTDAGKNWRKVYHDLGGSLFDVQFVGEDTAFAVGTEDPTDDPLLEFYQPVMLRSTNGGVTWVRIGSLPTNRGLRGIGFFSPQIGVAVGDSETIIRTTNGGSIWSADSITQFTSHNNNNFFVLGIVDDSTAITAGPRTDKYFKTTNQGTTWTSTSGVGGGGTIFTALCVRDSLHWYLCTNYGNFWKTTNGGGSWMSPFTIDFNKSLSDISMFDSSVGYGVGEHGMILMTSDGWQTYSFISSEFAEEYRCQTWINPDTGYAGGSNNRILITTNRGRSWTNQATPSPYAQIEDVDHLSRDTLIAVNWGRILRTTSGGSTWTSQYSDTSGEFYKMQDVECTRNGVVYVCGRTQYTNKAILKKSTDGGGSWADLTFPYNVAYTYFFRMQFLNQDTGYVVGSRNGAMLCLKTTNGGTSWSDVSTGGDGEAYDLYFTDSRHGYVDAGGSTLYKTSDGGASWQNLTTGVPAHQNDLGSMYFFDFNSGFVSLRTVGTIFYTTNGGSTWRTQVTPATYLRDIEFVSAGSTRLGFGVGSGIYCTVLSPLGSKIWTGGINTSWSEPLNWSPSGVPLKTDSVVIGPSGNNPVITGGDQLVAVGKLSILSGGRLTVTDDVNMFIVKGNVRVQGTLSVSAGARTNFIIGGSWFSVQAGALPSSSPKEALADSGFVPAFSTVLLTGDAEVGGTFYNLISDTVATVLSDGNIRVSNKCSFLNKLTLGNSDTLLVNDVSPQALFSVQSISEGTIRRGISDNSTEPYRFESIQTFVQFNGTGLYPDAMMMQARPGDSSRAFTLYWEAIPSVQNNVNRTVSSANVSQFSRWAFGAGTRPKFISSIPFYQPVVRRSYQITSSRQVGHKTAKGGILTAAPATLQLRYEESEIVESQLSDSLILLRGPIVIGDVAAKWNMVSLPVVPEVAHKDSVFPTIVSNLWSYSGTYKSDTEMVSGRGYWAKFNAAQKVSVLGTDKESEEIQLSSGWNMVGTISYGVDATQISTTPPGILTSQFFGYDSGYQAVTTLEPLHGYWVKSSAAGILRVDVNLSAQATRNAPTADQLHILSRLVISDADGYEQALYFGARPEGNPMNGEMPPPPPLGVFDARYESNKITEFADARAPRKIPIRISSAHYPVKIRWIITGDMRGVALAVATENHPLAAEGSVDIPAAPTAIALSLSAEPEVTMPFVYALEQNYPNPFNPVTIIRYQLREESRVALAIYDILGRKVQTLVDENQTAGRKSVEWNARSLPSGVYFCRIEALAASARGTMFRDTRKLMLLK